MTPAPDPAAAPCRSRAPADAVGEPGDVEALPRRAPSPPPGGRGSGRAAALGAGRGRTCRSSRRRSAPAQPDRPHRSVGHGRSACRRQRRRQSGQGGLGDVEVAGRLPQRVAGGGERGGDVVAARRRRRAAALARSAVPQAPALFAASQRRPGPGRGRRRARPAGPAAAGSQSRARRRPGRVGSGGGGDGVEPGRRGRRGRAPARHGDDAGDAAGGVGQLLVGGVRRRLGARSSAVRAWARSRSSRAVAGWAADRRAVAAAASASTPAMSASLHGQRVGGEQVGRGPRRPASRDCVAGRLAPRPRASATRADDVAPRRRQAGGQLGGRRRPPPWPRAWRWSGRPDPWARARPCVGQQLATPAPGRCSAWSSRSSTAR